MTDIPNVQTQLVYQADPAVMKKLREIWDRTYNICRKYMNQYVRIKTIHGQVYEGTIMHADSQYVFLKVSMSPDGSRPSNYTPYPPYNPYAETIMPLVLYELLAISLLD